MKLLFERELDGGVFIVKIAGEDVDVTAATSAAHHTRLLPHFKAVDHRAAHLNLRLEVPGDAELVEGPTPSRHHHVVIVELDGLHLVVPEGQGSGDCP